ncbi:cation transporter [Noviherbaspirillum sp. CPCC 100848]|uniref:Cation transporter n=1 Tax=Noviherbaspirillum album TaxID=3080276 RepID=A0ABU6JEW8_9BURK|nr:cation transporter [Noviherbaspirillum sp. CPCC 100848]MEC4722209.1 cation transporter [Noviherbaspirillum sp. CPCC 100848]
MDKKRDDEESEIALDARDAAQRRTLMQVLFINIGQAIVIGIVGLLAHSTGLMGAALDNLGDGLVYAVSVYAVGRTIVAKTRVARLSALFLFVLSFGLLIEVMRRFFSGGEPAGMIMIIAAIANALTNLYCLRLLRSHRREGVHLQASWVFTTNDMYSNAGIALSGLAVMYFKSPIPDLLIGLVVVVVAFLGGKEILEQASDADKAAN